LDADIQVHQQKISKLRDQMLSAKNNEQYRAFQHEIDFCEKEISKSEDSILEFMGQAEPLDRNVKGAEASLKKEKAEVEAEKNEARERTGKGSAGVAGVARGARGVGRIPRQVSRFRIRENPQEPGRYCHR